MSTIVKVAQDDDDFGENPLEVSWKNRGKTFNIPVRSYEAKENARSVLPSMPVNRDQPKERRQVFVERGE
jgi:hypothetical protein